MHLSAFISYVTSSQQFGKMCLLPNTPVNLFMAV